jgi:hypothetical protein
LKKLGFEAFSKGRRIKLEISCSEFALEFRFDLKRPLRKCLNIMRGNQENIKSVVDNGAMLDEA